MNKLNLFKHRDTLSVFEASCLMSGLIPSELGNAQKYHDIYLDEEKNQRDYLDFLLHHIYAIKTIKNAVIPLPAQNPYSKCEEASMVVEVDELRKLLKNFEINDCFFNPVLGEIAEQPLKPTDESNVYLNAQGENYAIELDIAIQAYKAVIIEGWTDNVKRNGYSDYLKAWVKSSYPNGSEAFINRISAVANPKKEIPSSK